MRGCCLSPHRGQGSGGIAASLQGWATDELTKAMHLLAGGSAKAARLALLGVARRRASACGTSVVRV